MLPFTTFSIIFSFPNRSEKEFFFNVFKPIFDYLCTRPTVLYFLWLPVIYWGFFFGHLLSTTKFFVLQYSSTESCQQTGLKPLVIRDVYFCLGSSHQSWNTGCEWKLHSRKCILCSSTVVVAKLCLPFSLVLPSGGNFSGEFFCRCCFVWGVFFVCLILRSVFPKHWIAGFEMVRSFSGWEKESRGSSQETFHITSAASVVSAFSTNIEALHAKWGAAVFCFQWVWMK